MDRKTNYFFILALIFVFVLQANAAEHVQIILALVLVTLFCLVAFLLRWLTLDGVYAAVVSGTLVFGLGGYPAAAILLIFFLSSSLISRNFVSSPEEEKETYAWKSRRDGLQVWSNGFWFTLFLLLSFVFEGPLFVVAALGAIAAATADTWATELGSRRFKSKTYLIDGFSEVPPGTDGGISAPGTLASLAGSLLIAFASVVVFPLHFSFIIPILLAGFLGSLADSYFGATYQQEGYTLHLPIMVRGNGQKLSLHFDNNLVNWLSTGLGSLLAIIFKLILI